MKNTVRRAMMLPAMAAAAATLLLAPGTVRAQGGPPGGGGGPGGGGFQMSPAARAKMNAYRKFNENHRNYREIGFTLRALPDFDKDPKTKISKAQAKQILAVINKWSPKKALTDDQARQANKELTGTFTIAQIKKMATMPRQGGRGGPGGGGGGGGFGGGRPGGGGGGFAGGPGGPRPGGGGPGGGGGARFDFSKMPNPKEYNPLNPNTLPQSPMSNRQKERWGQTMKLLKARAA